MSKNISKSLAKNYISISDEHCDIIQEALEMFYDYRRDDNPKEDYDNECDHIVLLESINKATSAIHNAPRCLCLQSNSSINQIYEVTFVYQDGENRYEVNKYWRGTRKQVSNGICGYIEDYSGMRYNWTFKDGLEDDLIMDSNGVNGLADVCVEEIKTFSDLNIHDLP